MVTQSVVAGTQLCPKHNLLYEIRGVLSKRRLWPVSFAALVWLILNTVLLSVVALARTETVSQVPNPPPQYLPGSILPSDASCFLHSGEFVPRCSVRFLNDDIYFSFDTDTHVIVKAAIPAQAYTVGQLILAWGRPSGSMGSKYIISVNWGTRSAILYTSSLRPDSQLEFIVYDAKPQPSRPWHGFRLPKN
jgi:hypothetical protein